ncbi:hypothetical protein H9X85_09545 [Anaerotignum lactatifermentans]|uniref:Right handed beta helix domain-containing protein n=1 Tax=Anaerotignum lactatifermentans TaxID=160404 RepID=A0ABS2GCD8_9FIRM|nr:hypothetical protein [Anaerotignum lactatifermentans]MBM6830050.1 hypothetical protein [Anaerotignum lactatifermentans]MBM6878293.1 hypothetical protein [Anaerotignum lactatifermentans]MBM6951448.1 hypothetical protein [Anaerotignum lactatifermentans]
MKKRSIALILALVMCVCLAGCGQGAGSDNAGAVSSNTPMPTEEYERALWYGLADETDDPERNVTQGEFDTMLTRLVELYKPEAMETWQNTSYIKEGDKASVFRFHGAIQLLYAAEAMDIADLPDGGYPTLNNDSVDWLAFWSLDWEKTDGWSEESFSESSEAITEAWVHDSEVLSHFHGGINFAVSRLSRVTGSPLLDIDVEGGTYLRLMDFLTYREAAVAVLRLYESNPEIAALFPEEEASAAVAEEILAQAEERRQSILNSETQIEYTGTAYYLSNDGDDSADGTSPETAWATIGRLNSAQLQKGDAVFFQRGDTWRGEMLLPQPYVTYSAYGEGAKPRLIGSPENGADPDKWSLLEGTDNIWVFYRDLPDCGMIVLDEKQSAEKILGFWDGTQYLDYVGPDNQSLGNAFSSEEILSADPFVVTEQLDRDLTFFSQADSELPDTLPIYLMGAYAEFTDEGCLAYRTQGPLYFRCDEGNPGKIYDSIEFVTPMPSIEVLSEGTVLDNLYIGFTQGTVTYHYNADNCRVQNCEVAWIGGCVTSYSFDDLEANPRGVTRFGDGINGASSHVTVQNNYIHSIIDCGICLEMFSGDGCSPVDTHYIGNLIYHVGSGLGYMNRDENADESHMFQNCTFEDNMVLFSGLSKENSFNEACAFAVDGGNNPQKDCAVRNNVFFCSRDALLLWTLCDTQMLPEFSGNQYIQYNSYPYLYVIEPYQKCWADQAEYVVREFLGDETGSYTTLYSFRWDTLNW